MKNSLPGWFLPALLIGGIFLFVKPVANFFKSFVGNIFGSNEDSKQLINKFESKGLSVTQAHADTAEKLQNCLNSLFFSDKDFVDCLSDYLTVSMVGDVCVVTDVSYVDLAAVYASYGSRKLWIPFPLESAQVLTVWIQRRMSDSFSRPILAEFSKALQIY